MNCPLTLELPTNLPSRCMKVTAAVILRAFELCPIILHGPLLGRASGWDPRRWQGKDLFSL